MTRYIKWDYDNKTAVEYERTGECNGCGACCQTLIKFQVAGVSENNIDQQGGSATDKRGVWAEWADGEKRRFFRFYEIPHSAEYHRCPVYSMHHKRCLAHEQKTLICSGFPFIPENIERFYECSYQFKEIQRWEIPDDPA